MRHVITQGEQCISADAEATIVTLLGSCVACCLWDPIAKVGGMNHILLARSAGRAGATPDLAGVNAMELLINGLLKLGADRKRLQAKAFGGAQMVSGLSDIGPQNAAFLKQFLTQEGIACISESLGGSAARQIVFQPTTGGVRLKMDKAVVVEPVAVPQPAAGNDLELF